MDVSMICNRKNCVNETKNGRKICDICLEKARQYTKKYKEKLARERAEIVKEIFSESDYEAKVEETRLRIDLLRKSKSIYIAREEFKETLLQSEEFLSACDNYINACLKEISNVSVKQ